MALFGDDDKTEEPSSRKLSKAREEGQVARSPELPAAAVTIAALGMLYLTGSTLISKMAEAFASGFHFDRKLVHSPNLLPAIFGHEIVEAFVLIAPLLLLTVVVACGIGLSIFMQQTVENIRDAAEIYRRSFATIRAEADLTLLTGDRHAAEDLVQETLVRAAQHWARVEPATADAYVRRILYTRSVDAWR